MSRRLIGTLTDPSGTPLAGWTLAIDALRNLTPSVPIGARESVLLDAAVAQDYHRWGGMAPRDWSVK